MLEYIWGRHRAPVFGLYEMVIDSIVPVGDKKQHLKINMHKYGREKSVCVMKFGISAVDFPFKQGDIVDTVVSIERNEFLGELRVSLFLKDIRLFETDDEEMVKGIRVFEKSVGKNSFHNKKLCMLCCQENCLQIYTNL